MQPIASSYLSQDKTLGLHPTLHDKVTKVNTKRGCWSYLDTDGALSCSQGNWRQQNMPIHYHWWRENHHFTDTPQTLALIEMLTWSIFYFQLFCPIIVCPICVYFEHLLLYLQPHNITINSLLSLGWYLNLISCEEKSMLRGFYCSVQLRISAIGAI